MARHHPRTIIRRDHPRRALVVRGLFIAVLAGLLAASLLVAAPAEVGAAEPLPLAGIVVVLDPGHNGGNATHIAEISRKVWIGTRWRPCNQVGAATAEDDTRLLMQVFLDTADRCCGDDASLITDAACSDGG